MPPRSRPSHGRTPSPLSGRNEVAELTLRTKRPVAFDVHARNRPDGPVRHRGRLRGGRRRHCGRGQLPPAHGRQPAQKRTTFTGAGARSPPTSAPCATATRAASSGSPGCRGSGKSTIATELERELFNLGRHVLRAGRRQHAPRALLRPRLLASRPQGEHPPRRRGGQAFCRRRHHLHHRVHFALPLRPRPGAQDRCRRASSWKCIVNAPLEGLRAARPQGPLRQGPRPARSRTSPASPRPMRSPSSRSCNSARTNPASASASRPFWLS